MRAVMSAMEYLNVTQYLEPEFLTFLISLGLVDMTSSQVRCCGTLRSDKNYGARCRNQIDKDELARAIQGLQFYAYRPDLTGKKLRTALDNLSIHLLCWRICRNDHEAYKQGNKLYDAIQLFRQDNKIDGSDKYAAEVIRRKVESARLARERDEAQDEVADLTDKLKAVELENKLLRDSLIPTAKTIISGRQSTPGSSKSERYGERTPAPYGFTVRPKESVKVKEEPVDGEKKNHVKTGYGKEQLAEAKSGKGSIKQEGCRKTTRQDEGEETEVESYDDSESDWDDYFNA